MTRDDNKTNQTMQLSEGDWEEINDDGRHDHATGQLSAHQITMLQQAEYKAVQKSQRTDSVQQNVSNKASNTPRNRSEQQMQTVKLSTTDLALVARQRQQAAVLPVQPSYLAGTMEASSAQWARYFQHNMYPDFVIGYMTDTKQTTIARWWEGMRSLPNDYKREIGVLLSSRIQGKDQIAQASYLVDLFKKLNFMLTIQWLIDSNDRYGQLLIFNWGTGYQFQQMVEHAPEPALIDAKLICNVTNNYTPQRVVLFNPIEHPLDLQVTFGAHDLSCTEVMY